LNNTGRQKKKSFLVKIEDDYYSFDVAESECDNQIALSPTKIKGEEIRL